MRCVISGTSPGRVSQASQKSAPHSVVVDQGGPHLEAGENCSLGLSQNLHFHKLSTGRGTDLDEALSVSHLDNTVSLRPFLMIYCKS